ncbi:MAG TPA: dual specificity protein phosphatase family protein [Terriglobales bacterium]|nr:dual specificity protein phosphatase family protein [Terriglobales bacterium]
MARVSASRKLGRRLFLVALMSAIAVGGAQESPNTKRRVAPPAKPAFGQKRMVRGISDFGEVTPTLFRGGQPTNHAFESLAKMGIAIVVDTRGNRAEGEGREVQRLGMKYVSIPWHCPFPHDDIFVKFLKLVRDNPEKKIFVHCRLGDDRTGMMVAAYRMAREGWSADEAMLEMQHFGFSSAHHFICPGLASYERNFPRHLKSNPDFDGLH